MTEERRIDLTTVPAPTFGDFHQLLAEAVIGLAHHVGQQNAPGIQALMRAAFERHHMLNASMARPPAKPQGTGHGPQAKGA